MALTNDQITAQNFKDFYNHIMPYLNGQPALNYSTDEQVVGTWIDGKPLYQKTIVSLNQTNINNTTVDIAENVDILISKEIMGIRTTDSAKNPVYIPYTANTTTNYDNFLLSGFFKDLNSNNNKLIWQWQLGATQDGRTHDFYITVRYTKTTDV